MPGGGLVFELDWYYHDQSDHGIDDIDVDIPAAIDHELAVAHLRRLAGGHAVERPDYDYHTHSRARAGVTIDPAPAIIVEGLFALYWEELRAVLDHGIFIQADHDLCLERRIARDTRERGRTAEQVKRQFREKVEPMFERYVAPSRRHAGLLLDGAGTMDAMIDRATTWLESQRNR
jgi:uridine kinase